MVTVCILWRSGLSFPFIKAIFSSRIPLQNINSVLDRHNYPESIFIDNLIPSQQICCIKKIWNIKVSFLISRWQGTCMQKYQAAHIFSNGYPFTSSGSGFSPTPIEPTAIAQLPDVAEGPARLNTFVPATYLS